MSTKTAPGSSMLKSASVVTGSYGTCAKYLPFTVKLLTSRIAATGPIWISRYSRFASTRRPVSRSVVSRNNVCRPGRRRAACAACAYGRSSAGAWYSVHAIADAAALRAALSAVIAEDPRRDAFCRRPPAAERRAAAPGTARASVIAFDDVRPAAVEQQAVFEHALFVRLAHLANRAAAEVLVAAEPLVAAGANLPAGLADPVGEIGFVPLRRHERLVDDADAIETCAADEPGRDHRVGLLNAAPVAGERAD